MTTPGKPVFGAGVLRYPQIMSPNFNLANPMASPANSWALLQSGLAYVFGLILSGGTITGPDYIIDPTGAYFYTGTPAAGNLSASVVPGVTAVTDPKGNSALAGVTSYDPATVTAMRMGSQGILAFKAATQAGPYGTAYGVLSFDTSGEIFLQNTLGGFSLQATIGFTITAGALGGTIIGPLAITGAVTATGGTPAAPTVIATDAWHSLGTLAGYTVNQARYRLTSENEVEFDVNITGTGANAASVAFSVTLGNNPNYRPLTLGKTYPLATNLAIAAMTSPPRLGITPAGVVTIAGTANIANTINYVGGAFMPLD